MKPDEGVDEVVRGLRPVGIWVRHGLSYIYEYTGYRLDQHGSSCFVQYKHGAFISLTVHGQIVIFVVDGLGDRQLDHPLWNMISVLRRPGLHEGKQVRIEIGFAPLHPGVERRPTSMADYPLDDLRESEALRRSPPQGTSMGFTVTIDISLD